MPRTTLQGARWLCRVPEPSRIRCAYLAGPRLPGTAESQVLRRLPLSGSGCRRHCREGHIAAGADEGCPSSRSRGPAGHPLVEQRTSVRGKGPGNGPRRNGAAELFVSPRTVEWHLGNVFTNLGLSSRRQLRSALPAPNQRRGRQKQRVAT
ncbi:LuxR C-terminal-related transcriptional regulator [Streptomyces sp. NPDC057950]|uniref:LuxR C-terminal-related transcriptional regulator n=1 Tax=Streptomyces sp. NPDC057950 TaxID=3346288 RepID=UPI0036E2A07E